MSIDGQTSKLSARSRPIEPVEIARILDSSSSNSPVKPSPAEHLGSPIAPPSSDGDVKASTPVLSPAFKRLSPKPSSRAKSTSLSFPIVPTQFSNPYKPLEAPKGSEIASTKLSGSLSTSEPNILQALAAQERLVLEIKEQLHVAEEELKRLKRQWALQESSRKKNEVRRVQHMRPMSVSVAKANGLSDDVDGSSTWLYEEMERKKSLLKNAKTSRRRVFPGSRHTRTLSLLSPEKMNVMTLPGNQLLPAMPDNRPSRPSRLSSSPDLPTLEDEDTMGVESNSDKQPPTPQRDAFVRSSKQMATDLKEGLWTFFEDLRQAAVGDEARVSTPEPGSSPPRQNNKTKLQRKPRGSEDSQLIDIGGSFWIANTTSSENSNALPERPVRKIAKPSRLSTTIPKPKTRTITDVNNEVWETWSSPASQAEVSGAPISKTPSHSNSNSEATTISPIRATRSRTSSIPKSPRKISSALPVPTPPASSMEPPATSNRHSRIPRLSLADQRALSFAGGASKPEVDKRRESMQWPLINQNVRASPDGQRAATYFSLTAEKMLEGEMF